MIGLALLLLQAAVPGTVPPPGGPTIVVTARRLSDTARALRDCLSRRCPPEEDIAASLAHGENQFVAGEYDAARTTLQDAIRRNRRFAATYPVAVASLYRGFGRIELHRGKPETFRLAAIDALDALRDGLPKRDPRVLAQRIEVADGYAHVASMDMAEAQYRAAARTAKAEGQPALQARATMKLAMLAIARTAVDPRYRPVARDAIAALGALSGQERERFAMVSGFLSAVFDERSGRPGAIDRFLAAHRTVATATPVAVAAPAIADFVPTADRPRILGMSGPYASSPSALDQWVDVSYWVLPDGRVGDPTILRHSQTFADFWAAPVLLAIGARRYLPLTLPADSPGLLQVERITRTAHRIGKGMRDGLVSFETLDLTAPRRDAVPDATPGATPDAAAQPTG